MTTAVAGSATALVTPSTVAAARAADADVSALLGVAAVALAWVVVLRLLLALLFAVGSRLPGAAGRTARRLAHAVTPRVLRSVVRVACGVAVAGTPLAAVGPALADTSGPSVRLVPAAPLPVLDRAIEPPAQTPPARHQVRDVVVRPGDTLWSIAARELGPGHDAADVARAWPRWYAANADRIGPDPARIRPGERLRVPVASS